MKLFNFILNNLFIFILFCCNQTEFAWLFPECFCGAAALSCGPCWPRSPGLRETQVYFSYMKRTFQKEKCGLLICFCYLENSKWSDSKPYFVIFLFIFNVLNVLRIYWIVPYIWKKYQIPMESHWEMHFIIIRMRFRFKMRIRCLPALSIVHHTEWIIIWPQFYCVQMW